jgi:hypothetical protein
MNSTEYDSSFIQHSKMDSIALYNQIYRYQYLRYEHYSLYSIRQEESDFSMLYFCYSIVYMTKVTSPERFQDYSKYL